MTKLTTVEWMYKELNNCLYREQVSDMIHELRKQLLAMEKEQMIKFAFDFYYKHSKKMGVPFNLISENRINAEQYYNETYGGDK